MADAMPVQYTAAAYFYGHTFKEGEDKNGVTAEAYFREKEHLVRQRPDILDGQKIAIITTGFKGQAYTWWHEDVVLKAKTGALKKYYREVQVNYRTFVECFKRVYFKDQEPEQTEVDYTSLKRHAKEPLPIFFRRLCNVNMKHKMLLADRHMKRPADDPVKFSPELQRGGEDYERPPQITDVQAVDHKALLTFYDDLRDDPDQVQRNAQLLRATCIDKEVYGRGLLGDFLDEVVTHECVRVLTGLPIPQDFKKELAKMLKQGNSSAVVEDKLWEMCRTKDSLENTKHTNGQQGSGNGSASGKNGKKKHKAKGIHEVAEDEASGDDHEEIAATKAKHATGKSSGGKGKGGGAKSKDKTTFNADVTCGFCFKTGHKQDACFMRRDVLERQKKFQQSKVNAVQAKAQDQDDDVAALNYKVGP